MLTPSHPPNADSMCYLLPKVTAHAQLAAGPAEVLNDIAHGRSTSVKGWAGWTDGWADEGMEG